MIIVYLKNVCAQMGLRRDGSVEKDNLYRLVDHGFNLPKRDTYILQTKELEDILLDREIRGDKFSRRTLEISRSFFRMTKEFILTNYSPNEIVEQVNLIGSDNCMFPTAFLDIYDRFIRRNFVVIDRYMVDGRTDEYGRQIFATRLGSSSKVRSKGKVLVMSELMATGISAYDSFDVTIPILRPELEKVVILTLGGSKTGAEKVYKKLIEFDLEVTIVFGLGIFPLAKDGTALAWFTSKGEEPITFPEYIKMAKHEKGFLPDMDSIGEIGDRFADPDEYLKKRNEEEERIKEEMDKRNINIDKKNNIGELLSVL